MKNIIIDADTGVDDSLAKAYLKDKTLPKKLKKVVSMGGCIDVPGNINNYAEANIHGDAKAADIVMGGVQADCGVYPGCTEILFRVPPRIHGNGQCLCSTRSAGHADRGRPEPGPLQDDPCQCGI